MTEELAILMKVRDALEILVKHRPHFQEYLDNVKKEIEEELRKPENSDAK